MKIGIHPVRYDFFTKYKNIEESLKSDPLNFTGSVTANTVSQVQGLIDDIPQRLWNKIKTSPIVVIHGECDKYGNGYNAYQFYNEIKSEDKELWYYQKMNFAFMLEDEYPDIESRLVSWLHKHVEVYKEKHKESDDD